MSWSVTVYDGGTKPDVRERIASFSCCPGNMYYCVKELCGMFLHEMTHKELQIGALVGVIAELDKGNDGKFNDQYCVDADEKWSKGKETKKDWLEWSDIISRRPDLKLGFHDYTSFCGHTIRARCREDAVRFYLYYKAGYDVIFKW